MQRNIHTQREWSDRESAALSAQTGTYPPTEEQKRAAGWRECPPVPEVAAGYTRIGTPRLVEIDGVTQWEVTDRATAELEAEAAEAVKAASLERWVLDNAFLMVCQGYFGDVQKRGTAELLKKAFDIVAADQVAGMKAFAVVIGLDKELVRVAGDRWWDDCVWHDDADAIAGAQALLQEMGG
jgi:hypothetical protein